MANYVIVVDEDESRRSRFIKEITPNLCIAEYLRVDSCDTGSFSAVWASFEGAPITVATDDDGAAIVWGEAIEADSVTRLDAAQLRRDRAHALHDAWAAFDGYYAAAVYSVAEGVTVEADLLGFYPVYYFSTVDVLLVGSSPELLIRHPLVRQELDPHGFASILLTNGLLDGRTIWLDIRRLGPGYQLQWTPGEGTREVVRYELPVSDRLFGAPYSYQVSMLNDAVDQAVARHASAGRSYVLLLSGGMDSRLLGGYLEAQGAEVKALTFGLPTDVGVVCARRVAHTLHFDHHYMPLPLAQYPQLAELSSRWEHLAGGFNLIFQWGIPPVLREQAPYAVMGNALDQAIGNRYLEQIYSPETASVSFQTHFERMNSWSIAPETLKSLLKPTVFVDAVDECVDRFHQISLGYAGLDFQRIWVFILHHRQRFHVASMAWVYASGSWPVLPVLDRKLLETAAAMPANVVAERRGEQDLIIQRFPNLAQLPLDQGDRYAVPLKPRLRHQITWPIQRQLMPAVDLWERLTHSGGIERRFVQQIMDFSSSPGWADVRKRAERDRHKVLHLFDENKLNEFLAPPDIQIPFDQPVFGPSGRKLLLGFMLFAGQHW